MKNPKIAIYVNGGVVQAIRSNISEKLEIEIIDEDDDLEYAQDRWDVIQDELKFGNY